MTKPAQLFIVHAAVLLVMLVVLVMAIPGSSDSQTALGIVPTPTNTPGPTPTPKPNGAGNLSGVYDVMVHDGTKTADLIHCITRTDHDSVTNEVKTAAQCYDNLGFFSDPNAEPLNDPPGEGPDGLIGPPPPPPYSPAAPAKGAGFYNPGTDTVVTTTCFAQVGGSLAPNSIWTVTAGGKAQLASAGKQSGTVDIWGNQPNSACDSLTPVGTPFLAGLPINLNPISDQAPCPGGDCEQVPWRTANDTDWDNDGCSDADELWQDKRGSTTKCGDDPWNPYDPVSGSPLDVSGSYSISAIAIKADDDGPGGAPPTGGFFFTCLADMQQSVKALAARTYCYIDSPVFTVNKQAAGGNLTCPPAAANLCGGGLPGAPPPGITVAGGPRLFGDIDDKHTVLIGVLNNTENRIDLQGCFEDRDGQAALGNVYARAKVGAHTGHGFVSMWFFQATANCTGGTPIGSPTNTFPMDIVRQAPKAANRDTDSDGCSDKQELSDSVLRDPFNSWDSYDTDYNHTINTFDILGVASRFGTNDAGGTAPVNRYSDPHLPAASGYHPAFDRGGRIPGGNGWNILPPDGVINAADIALVASLFGSTCAKSHYGPVPIPGGALAMSGTTATMLAGSPIRWVCDAGDPAAQVAIRFYYTWGTTEISGLGAISFTQRPPVNVLNQVECVVSGSPAGVSVAGGSGLPITINGVDFAPSGRVISSGLPIFEATVTLQVETSPGVWVSAGAAIKEPDLNPEYTGPDGRFAWEVTGPGTYRVRVSRYSCTPNPAYSSQVTLQQAGPLSGLDVNINCPDDNLNGIPDVWEDLYGISNPNGDPDGDTLTNLDELNLGTNPNVADNVDADGDGCVNLKKVSGNYEGELSSTEQQGGRRDGANQWDFFDPDKSVGSERIHRVGDILAVSNHYYQDTESDYDRSYVGPNKWNLGPPDGQIRTEDILFARDAYFNDCP